LLPAHDVIHGRQLGGKGGAPYLNTDGRGVLFGGGRGYGDKML
jgi:hypothetical protein